MSSDIAIRVKNICKYYQIYDKPQDRLKQSLWRGKKQFYREFKALDDISFEVKKGETVGIIGRNGSGKSTLLQIICSTLAPTSGSIEVNGRVAALLELGAGFNPEFSGQENIYLNASILGLSKKQIDVQYDNIISFADIGEFVHRQVKTYSSGMYVRLAFSIAIHTSPDILIVDEALSVGDIYFQNKCMKRIQKLKQQGTSILFVSHDISTMQIICDRVLWINKGYFRTYGHPISVCQDYYSTQIKRDSRKVLKRDISIPQKETHIAKFTDITLFDAMNSECHSFCVGETMSIHFELAAESDLEETIFSISIYRSDGDWSIGQTSAEKEQFWPKSKAGDLLKGKLILHPISLTPANYSICLSAFSIDLQTCYAMTELSTTFSIRSNYQTWGRFIHPCEWVNDNKKMIGKEIPTR